MNAILVTLLQLFISWLFIILFLFFTNGGIFWDEQYLTRSNGCTSYQKRRITVCFLSTGFLFTLITEWSMATCLHNSSPHAHFQRTCVHAQTVVPLHRHCTFVFNKMRIFEILQSPSGLSYKTHDSLSHTQSAQENSWQNSQFESKLPLIFCSSHRSWVLINRTWSVQCLGVTCSPG